MLEMDAPVPPATLKVVPLVQLVPVPVAVMVSGLPVVAVVGERTKLVEAAVT